MGEDKLHSCDLCDLSSYVFIILFEYEEISHFFNQSFSKEMTFKWRIFCGIKGMGFRVQLLTSRTGELCIIEIGEK